MEPITSELVQEEPQQKESNEEVVPVEVTLYDLSYHFKYFVANPNVKWVLKDPQIEGCLDEKELKDRAEREDERLTQRAKQIFEMRQRAMQEYTSDLDSSGDEEDDEDGKREMDDSEEEEETELLHIHKLEKRTRSSDCEDEDCENVKRICIHGVDQMFIEK